MYGALEAVQLLHGHAAPRKIASMVAVLPSSELKWNIIQPSKLAFHLQRGPTAIFGCCFAFQRYKDCEWWKAAPPRVPMQVFSKAALGSYLSQHQRCESSLPFWSWGEDRREAGRKLAQHLVRLSVRFGTFIPCDSWYWVNRGSEPIPLPEVYGRMSRDAGGDLAMIDSFGFLGPLDLPMLQHWHMSPMSYLLQNALNAKCQQTGQMYSEVKTQPDYLNFLHDERCWGVDCGNKAAVAFHSLLGSVCCTERRHFRNLVLNVFATSLLPVSAYKSKNRTHNPPWNFCAKNGATRVVP